MVEKQINGYLYNHTKQKFLEIYIYNHLGHIKHNLENIAAKYGFKITKKEQADKVNGLTRYYIFYDNYDLIKSLYSELNNDLKIKSITYYDSIKVVRTLLKNQFR